MTFNAGYFNFKFTAQNCLRLKISAIFSLKSQLKISQKKEIFLVDPIALLIFYLEIIQLIFLQFVLPRFKCFKVFNILLVVILLLVFIIILLLSAFFNLYQVLNIFLFKTQHRCMSLCIFNNPLDFRRSNLYQH